MNGLGWAPGVAPWQSCQTVEVLLIAHGLSGAEKGLHRSGLCPQTSPVVGGGVPSTLGFTLGLRYNKYYKYNLRYKSDSTCT